MSNWYQFNQNNSGGYFITNDKVCHRLLIEAETFTEAVEKAEDLGCYWDGVSKGIDCSCCGDRWSQWDDEPVNLTGIAWKDLNFSTIEEYAQYFADDFGWTTPEIRLYYKDGNVKEIFSCEDVIYK